MYPLSVWNCMTVSARQWVSLRTGRDLSRALEVTFSPGPTGNRMSRARSFRLHKAQLSNEQMQPGSFRSDSMSIVRPLQHQNPADQVHITSKNWCFYCGD